MPPLKFSLLSDANKHLGLIDKCKQDIDKFQETYKKFDDWHTNTDNDLDLMITEFNKKFESLNTFENFVNIVNDAKDGINNIWKESNTYLNKMHQKISITDKYALWIYRTYMFYALLCIATMSFLDKATFNTIYENPNKVNIGNHIPDFIEITQDILLTYELGIFGSLTPTSDIDIGIQYAYNNANSAKQNLLSYFVKHFENLFII